MCNGNCDGNLISSYTQWHLHDLRFPRSFFSSFALAVAVPLVSSFPWLYDVDVVISHCEVN